MKFLTIFVTVFGGGTFWVAADYFVEYRALPQVTNARGQTSLTNYLYECMGVPPGTKAYQTFQSRCTRITSWTRKIQLYSSVNFYNVYRPTPRDHAMLLPYQCIMPSVDEWNIGFYNHDIDHPNFAAPLQADINHFANKLEQLRFDNVIPYYLVDGIAAYLAQTNLIALAGDPVRANSLFLGFSNFLGRLMARNEAINEETDLAIVPTLRDHLKKGMMIAFGKMIDPCCVLHGNLRPFASQYCAVYCNFLSFFARYFNTCASKFSTLQGGQCVGLFCTCTRVINNPFAGCDPDGGTSTMQFSHNSMRAELNQ